MNIVMVNSGVLNTDTGGGVHFLEIYKSLSKNNNVVCFTAKSKGEVDDSFIQVPYVNFPLLRALTYHILVFFILSIYLHNNSVNFIYIRKSQLSAVIVLLCKISGTKCGVEVNGLIKDELKMMDHHSWFLYTLTSFLDYIVYNFSTVLFCVTNEISENIKSRYKTNAKIITTSNGVNSHVFHPMNRRLCLSRVGLPENNYVTFVGCPAPWHGLEDLVIVSKRLMTQRKDAHFLIVGEGPYLDTVKQLVSENGLDGYYTFTGRVPHNLIPVYINASSVCVAPFCLERNVNCGTSPLKVFEYASCGVPTIVSNVNGFGRMVEDMGAGISYEPGDLDQLFVAINKVLNGDFLVDRQGLHRHIAEQFDWDAIALDVLRQITWL